MSGNCQMCGEHCLDCQCDKQSLVREMPEAVDMVNNPPHYQGTNFEAIDVIEEFGLNFHLGNAVKYILRAGKKGDRKEDLSKAIWYLEREIADEI